MTTVKPHPVYSQDAVVHIVTGDDKNAILEDIIERSKFLDHLEEQYKLFHAESGKSKHEFKIAIKPNIMTASEPQPDSSVYTDPQLVEQLIAKIRQKGFKLISVVETQNVFNYAYEERTVTAVAKMCGYSSDGYEVIDMTVPHKQDEWGDKFVEFDYGGILGRHPVATVWQNADYRISFAKNKTHWQCFYTACIKNVYGCLPQWDKMRHYHGKKKDGRDIEFYHAAVLMADRFPVHFGFLDAWRSGDGLTGHVRDANPNDTHAILASQNIFALDWVAGEKMNIDPTINYVIQEALHRWGTIKIERDGDMTPWENWHNVRRITVLLLNIFEEYYQVGRFMSRAMANRMDPQFPPVKRWQWFFAMTQGITGIVENLLVEHPSAKP